MTPSPLSPRSSPGERPRRIGLLHGPHGRPALRRGVNVVETATHGQGGRARGRHPHFDLVGGSTPSCCWTPTPGLSPATSRPRCRCSTTRAWWRSRVRSQPLGESRPVLAGKVADGASEPDLRGDPAAAEVRADLAADERHPHRPRLRQPVPDGGPAEHHDQPRGLVIEDFNMTFEVYRKRLGRVAFTASASGDPGSGYPPRLRAADETMGARPLADRAAAPAAPGSSSRRCSACFSWSC